tara:strand:- start:96 stop:1115 length:1020 start_codon:yes stop_codon:yes gene_type:complete
MANIANHEEGSESDLSKVVLDTFRWMILARTFEDRISNIYRSGKIFGGVYVGKGQEAFSASMAINLVKGQDVYSPLIRDMAGRSAFGEPLVDAARTYMGSSNGPTKGRDGNVHRGNPREGMPTMISHLGAMISVVSGVLFARRIKGTLNNSVGATTIGDGGTSTGAFHEALNLAAVEKLPLIVSIANNQFAYSTPTSKQFACHDLVDKAVGYGVNGINVDGTDLIDCIQGFQSCIQKARAGEGPQIVVGNLLRLSGHGEHDDAPYISEEIKKSKLGIDCLKKSEKRILDEGWCNQNDIDDMFKNAVNEVNSAIETAESESAPDPYSHDWNAYSSVKFDQ